jgi:hypothetical protein
MGFLYSYGYLGGQLFAQIALLRSIILSPVNDTAQTGKSRTVLINTYDNTGNPVRGLRVDMKITGANPQNTFIITDSAGRATLTYTGENAGADSIRGSSGLIVSNPVSKYWIKTASVSSIVLAPVNDSLFVNSIGHVNAKITKSDGTVANDCEVTFIVKGVNDTLGKVTTDIHGAAVFSYTGINRGNDTIVATVGSVTSNQVYKRWDTLAIQISSVELSPSTGEQSLGGRDTVWAKVTKENGAVASGVNVKFTVRGISLLSGNAVTNESGMAMYVYQRFLVGKDTIFAATDSVVSNKVTRRWICGSITFTHSVIETSGMYRIKFTSVTGGVAPYRYTVNNKETYFNTETFDVHPGIYFLSVKDSLNCESEIVEISVLKEITVTDVTYFDRDADGYIDYMVIVTDKSIAEKDGLEIVNALRFSSLRDFTIDNKTILIKENNISFEVKEGRGHLPRTSVDYTDRVTVTGTILQSLTRLNRSEITIRDSMSPVIIKAEYRLNTSRGISPVREDSLFVTFSEKVSIAGNGTEIIKFKNETGTEYSADLTISTNNENRVLFIVSQLIGTDMPSAMDSVWINTKSQIRDTLLNYQYKDNNRRAILELTGNIVKVTIAPNPFIAGGICTLQGELRESFGNLINKKNNRSGVLVVIKSLTPLKITDGKIGIITIYDAVQNTVCKELPIVTGLKSAGYGVYWDGISDNGRYVSTGSYLFLVKLFDSSVTERVFKFLVGVKRN